MERSSAARGSAPVGFVLPGAITVTAAIDGPGNFTMFVIGMVVAIAIAFVLTMVLGFKDLPETKHVAGR